MTNKFNLPITTTVHNIQQRSDEWLSLKAGRLSGSMINDFISLDKRKSKTVGYNVYSFKGDIYPKINKLIATKLLGFEENPVIVNDTMLRGQELEPIAKSKYLQSLQGFDILSDVGFITKGDILGYSPDGLMNNDTLIEIKCPLLHTHLGYLLDNKIPDQYTGQIQLGLYITGYKKAKFISYYPLEDLREQQLVVIDVEPDLEYFNKIIELEEKILMHYALISNNIGG